MDHLLGMLLSRHHLIPRPLPPRADSNIAGPREKGTSVQILDVPSGSLGPGSPIFFFSFFFFCISGSMFDNPPLDRLPCSPHSRLITIDAGTQQSPDPGLLSGSRALGPEVTATTPYSLRDNTLSFSSCAQILIPHCPKTR